MPKSRAPHHPAGRTPVEVEDAIVAKCKELDDAGWDCGPESIAFTFYLRDLPGLPSVSTIWRILKARGQIVPQPAKAPKHSGRSFTTERVNECWALNVEDDHSRYCVAATAMLKSCTGAAALAVLAAAAAFLGWPARFWSDNAKAFKAALASALAPIGVAASHSRPYHPKATARSVKTCGALRLLWSDPCQGMTVVSCVRFVGQGWRNVQARIGRTN